MSKLRPLLPGEVRRVILGVDPAAGVPALRFAVELTRALNGELHAVRGWNPVLAWHNSAVNRERKTAARRDAEQGFPAAFDDALGGWPVGIRVCCVTREGVPGLTLVDYADRVTDIIVVGGATGPRWMTGGGAMTRLCVKNARVPVIVVPPPHRSEKPTILSLIRLFEDHRAH